MTQLARLGRAIAALVVLAILLAGVPAALLTWGRSPLDGHGSLLEQLQALPTQAVSDHVAFGLLTAATWAAWAIFVISVAIEAAAACGRAAQSAPALGPIQLGARQLILAITASIATAGPLTASPAGALPAIAPTTATAPPAPDYTQPSIDIPATAPPGSHHVGGTLAPALAPVLAAAPQPSAAAGSNRSEDHPTITVVEGDTPWGLAEQHLGSGFRWRDLWELNHNVPQPDGHAWTVDDIIYPGWILRLPTDATITNDHATNPAETEDQSDSEEAASSTDSQADSPDAGPSGNGPAADASSRPGPTGPDPTDNNGGQGTDGTPEPVPTTTLPTTNEVGPTPTSLPGADRPSDADGQESRHTAAIDNVDEDSSDGGFPLAGVTGATVLASGVALWLYRKRRHQPDSVRGRQRAAQRRTGRGRRTEHNLVAAANVPLVRWAGQELADMVARLDPQKLDAAPVAIELSDTEGIELLWDRPALDAPAPWQEADGGWSWRLAWDPDAPVPADERPCPIPALVTVGERDGRQLLIDLEAYGTLTVTGDPDRVADWGRAAGLELGVGDDLSDAWIATTGTSFAGDQPLRRVVTTNATETVKHIASQAGSVQDAIDEGYQTSFHYRAGWDGHLEAVVAIVPNNAEDNVADELLAASEPRRGVATILLDPDHQTRRSPDGDNNGAVLHIDTDGNARLDPLGLEFRAAGLPQATLDQLTALTSAYSDAPDYLFAFPDDIEEDADPSAQTPRPIAEPTGWTNSVVGELAGRASAANSNGDTDSWDEFGSQDDEEPSADLVGGRLLVRVLGAPSVPDRPELRRPAVMMATYLACHGTTTRSALVHAIWGGNAVSAKSIANRITETRAGLGTHNGEELLPSVKREAGIVTISDRVVTDLALLQQAYTDALDLPSSRAIPLLQAALAFVDGEPFNAPGYEWAHEEQLVAEAANLIEEAGLLLANLAIEAGDTSTAREALVQALRGLPGNEPLVRARMQLEHDLCNPAGVHTAWHELEHFLTEIEAEPSPATIALYRQLTGRSGEN